MMKLILSMYFIIYGHFFRTWELWKGLVWLIILLIGKRTAILISYHVRFSTYACTCSDYYWCAPSKIPWILGVRKFDSLFVASWWYQGTVETLNNQSDFKWWLYQCKLHNGKVRVSIFFLCNCFLNLVSDNSKTMLCMKPAGYWGQQSFNIYFYPRSPSEHIWGFLGNGLPISMPCNCHGHSVW